MYVLIFHFARLSVFRELIFNPTSHRRSPAFVHTPSCLLVPLIIVISLFSSDSSSNTPPGSTLCLMRFSSRRWTSSIATELYRSLLHPLGAATIRYAPLRTHLGFNAAPLRTRTYRIRTRTLSSRSWRARARSQASGAPSTSALATTARVRHSPTPCSRATRARLPSWYALLLLLLLPFVNGYSSRATFLLLLQCKHQLAVRLAPLVGKCRRKEVGDDQFADELLNSGGTSGSSLLPS